MKPRSGILQLLYGAYAWLVFALAAPLLWIPVVLWPGQATRRRNATRGMHLIARLIGVPIEVRHAERLPRGPCIVVANHISYLDGPMLLLALPPSFSFVVKEEASRIPVAAMLLRQMGVTFVSRFNPRQGSSDARRLMRMIRDGQCLGFFPEGHIQRVPGLQPFRLGAFLIAAHCQVPVVPVVIRGTREFLPRNVWLPRRGPISLSLLPAISAQGSGREAALQLRDRAYAAILAHCDEPAAARSMTAAASEALV